MLEDLIVNPDTESARVRPKAVRSQGLFGLVLAQLEFLWGDLLEQVPIRLQSKMSLAKTIYRDTWVMTHLCVLDSLDGEPLPKWSGPIRELKTVSQHSLFLDLRMRVGGQLW